MTRFKIIISLVTAIALAIIVFLSRDDIVTAFSDWKNINWWWFVLQIPIQLLSYFALAHLYHSYLKTTSYGQKLPLKEMYKISLELNCVNSTLPSGGASGFAYLNKRLKSFDIPWAVATLVQTLRFILTFSTFLIILGAGLVFLAIEGQINDLILLAGASIFLITIFGIGIFVFLVSSKRRINLFTAWLPKAINKVFKFFHYKSKKELINMAKVERNLNTMHTDYLKIYKNLSSLKKPFLYALAVNFFELLTIYVVFLAIGKAINPGAIIFAYAIANFAGLIAITPGGIGAYEGLMIFSLESTGVVRSYAISGTLLYRVTNLLVFIPIGWVLLHLALSKMDSPVKKKGVFAFFKNSKK